MKPNLQSENPLKPSNLIYSRETKIRESTISRHVYFLIGLVHALFYIYYKLAHLSVTDAPFCYSPACLLRKFLVGNKTPVFLKLIINNYF